MPDLEPTWHDVMVAAAQNARAALAVADKDPAGSQPATAGELRKRLTTELQEAAQTAPRSKPRAINNEPEPAK